MEFPDLEVCFQLAFRPVAPVLGAAKDKDKSYCLRFHSNIIAPYSSENLQKLSPGIVRETTEAA